jgi:hypothetical protein
MSSLEIVHELGTHCQVASEITTGIVPLHNKTTHRSAADKLQEFGTSDIQCLLMRTAGRVLSLPVCPVADHRMCTLLSTLLLSSAVTYLPARCAALGKA